jgi:hypothetical protein
MKSHLILGMAALALAGCVTPLETDSRSSPPAPVSPAPARQAADVAPAPQHPEAPRDRGPGEAGAQLGGSVMSLFGFSGKYQAAGSPRVAILFNRQFASQLTSWTMESREILQDVAALGFAGSAATDLVSPVEGQSGSIRTSAEVGAVAAKRSETFREFQDPGQREGFSSEYVEWKFREAFSAPFHSAAIRVVDSDLITQAARRAEDVDAGRQRISDVNTNLSALKEKADWIVEVLMVQDPRAPAGYLFRAEVKDLESGAVLASAISHFDEFRKRPVRRKITAVAGGYRIEEEELPAPTIGEYAEDLAVRLLSELNRRLDG